MKLTENYVLHRSAMHHPWMARDPSLLFRGSNLTGVNTRPCVAFVHKAYNTWM